MGSLVVPRVTIKEESIAAPITGTATGRMAYVVESVRGMAGKFLFVTNEQDLVNYIGKPTDDRTSKDFHVCKSFLAYGNDLVVVRALHSDATLSRIGVEFSQTDPAVLLNAVSDTKYIENKEQFSFGNLIIAHPGLDLAFYSKEAYVDGDLITVSICVPTEALWQNETVTIDGSTKFSDAFEFGPAATKSEIALVVLVNGVITEKWIVSVDPDNKNENGENNYINEYLDKKSSYIWGFANGSISYAGMTSFQQVSLNGGSVGSTPTDADFESGYEMFTNKNDISFDYITEGTHYNNRLYIMSSIVEGRKDCIGFFGPKAADILGITDANTIVANIVTDRLTLPSSSWCCYYGNWKQMYDKYRDVNIWIPITGDIIGNKVRINTNKELWTPAAGNINGSLLNISTFAFNPNFNQQNELYKNGVNHVVKKVGKGFIVDGQKTMTSQNIGVSRLNIRELFRFVETFIGAAAEDLLHDYNTAITRARWVGQVTPFLEDIQRRGGIVDFQVVCDETNNPPAIVDNYGFRCTIKIKGTRAIEDVTITFFDVPTSVDFAEVPGV
jgi:hypothetical protein